MLLLLLQLAGTAVFAIGLWLRLDPKTKGLFEGPEAPYVFYTGKMVPPSQQLLSLNSSSNTVNSQVLG